MDVKGGLRRIEHKGIDIINFFAIPVFDALKVTPQNVKHTGKVQFNPKTLLNLPKNCKFCRKKVLNSILVTAF